MFSPSGDQSKSYLQKILQIFQGPNWLKVALQSTTAGITSTGTALDVALAPSENHIGAVGGNSVISTSSVVMTVAGAYITGDYMGTTTTPQTFANASRVSGGTGIIKSISITDKVTTTNVAMELWIFSNTFVAPTDNTAWTITDTEALTVLGVIPITTANWYASGANQVYFDGSLSMVIKPNVTSLYYALVARGATPAFTSLDLQISLGILQD